MRSWTTVVVLAGLSLVQGLPRPSIPRLDFKRQGPIIGRNGDTLPPYDTVYHFDQLIDHGDPSKGNFKQRYWTTWEFYKKGGPIILMIPGESDASGYNTAYLGNTSINGLIAQQQNGATIILEHRFFGTSNPYNNLTAASFSVHTVDQAINDLIHFANNVQLPMPGGDAVSPKKAPWIVTGGSYGGALAAWTKAAAPQTFYAAYASSAVVEAIDDFWKYFQPIQEHMPANCSADIQKVIAHVDSVITGPDQNAINKLKALFGLSGLGHLDDFAASLRIPMFYWQQMQTVQLRYEPAFYEFCDYLEVKDGVSASSQGWGLENTLKSWGNYSSTQFVPGRCAAIGSDNVEDCFGTHNASSTTYTDISVGNDERAWYWLLCNQVGWYQASAPPGTPTLVSRTIHADYDARLCSYYFPEKFGKYTPVADTVATNSKYGGWSINEPRLFFAVASRDPWREATMAAQEANVKSTDLQPIAMSDGFHCSDLLTAYGQDSTVRAVQDQALASMKGWLAEWSAPTVA